MSALVCVLVFNGNGNKIVFIASYEGPRKHTSFVLISLKNTLLDTVSIPGPNSPL